jgi:general secretion pathway protein F
MAAFEYQAVDAGGKTQKGLIEADTARQARQQLRGMNLMPLEVGEVSSRESKTGERRSRDKLNVQTISLITRQLATLISAGQPIESAYHAVSRQTPKPAAKRVLLAVRARVLEGYALSDALRDYPRIFDSMYCASVHAGDVVMERLADHMEARQDLQRRTGQALIYPILLSVVAFGLVSALLTFVVPKIVQVFEGFDQELPMVTTWLIGLSDFFKNYGLALIISVIVLSIVYAQLLKFPGFRVLRDRSRFTRTMSILVSSGVTALDSMHISTEVINNQPIKAAVQKAASRVREGEHISVSLENTGYFSPLVLQLIQNGEASGKLGDMLERSARAEENEFAAVTALFIGLFEPAMILLMGVVVLFIVIAILIPIFDMNELV